MDYRKLGPGLVSALNDYQRSGREALGKHVGVLGVVSVKPTPKPARMVVFLHPAKGASLDHLATDGVEINGGEGTIRTGIVPLDALERVTGDPAVARVVPAVQLEALLDLAADRVRLPILKRHLGLTGKGVIVGVIDSGIEVTHPNFEGRILRIWDQTLNGPGVTEGAYGQELTDNLLGLSRDTNGHGTHVAGIAASADQQFEGVAPGADLLIVKSDMMSAHLADAVRYIFRVAGELGRPAVVNMSLGGHGDAHDGTDSLSQVIDAAVGPGRIVCCAAGNEGTDNIHAQLTLKKNSTRTIPMAMLQMPAGQFPPYAALNIWFEATDQLEIAVVGPSNAATPYQGLIDGDNPSRTYQLPDGEVELITPTVDPANGDINFLAVIQPNVVEPGAPRGTGAWRLRVKAGAKVRNGRVDVWSIRARVAQFTGTSVKDNMKVGAPGCATQAVTVGAFTTRSDWENHWGDPQHSGLELNDIADFSSEGPRRDGAAKPDVVAPGAMIVSCLSAHSGVDPAFLIDSLNTIMAGTSQACPFVAGLVALLLEKNPKLDPAGVKKALKEASAIPGKPKGTWDEKWGYGLVDASKLAPKKPPAKKQPPKKQPPKKAPAPARFHT